MTQEPRDVARSLNHLIRNLADNQGVDPQRVRRHVVFERILARLGRSEDWVLKGGFCLELRFSLSARATQDLDVVARRARGLTDLELQEVLEEALAEPVEDAFSFRVSRPRPLRREWEGSAWRVTITAELAGYAFETVKLDIVSQVEEVTGAVEWLVIDPVVPLAGEGHVRVLAVDVAQHAAEKLHAYARLYVYEQPSSRVKDLVDLALLAEAGVVAPGRLRRRLERVYAVRNSCPPPLTIPEPPPEWAPRYAQLVEELSVTSRTSRAAYALVVDLYHRAMSTQHDEENDEEGDA